MGRASLRVARVLQLRTRNGNDLCPIEQPPPTGLLTPLRRNPCGPIGSPEGRVLRWHSFGDLPRAHCFLWCRMSSSPWLRCSSPEAHGGTFWQPLQGPQLPECFFSIGLPATRRARTRLWRACRLLPLACSPTCRRATKDTGWARCCLALCREPLTRFMPLRHLRS